MSCGYQGNDKQLNPPIPGVFIAARCKNSGDAARAIKYLGMGKFEVNRLGNPFIKQKPCGEYKVSWEDIEFGFYSCAYKITGERRNGEAFEKSGKASEMLRVDTMLPDDMAWIELDCSE